MKTLKTLTVILTAIILFISCTPSKWTTIDKRQDKPMVVDAEHLLVPAYDTEFGEDLFLEIKNTEPNSVKHVIVNGVPIGELNGGDAIYCRLTDAIYTIAPIKYERGRSVFSGSRITQLWVLIEVQVDIIKGGGKKHYIKEKWLSPDDLRHQKWSLEI